MEKYNYIFDYINSQFTNSVITENDLFSFKNIINKESILELLHDIINNDDLLEKISQRSYTHALGFDKIVLMDLSKDVSANSPKTQLRLHLWHPEINGVPMIESLHEHSFNFISTVLSGKLENQVFNLENLKDDDLILLKKFELALSKLTKEDVSFVNTQIEILEAYKLKEFGSDQFDTLNLSDSFEKDKCKELLCLNEEEFLKLATLEKHYVSDRIRGERKKYKHVFNKYVKLTPHNILKVNANDYYFHSYLKPHRLYYDNKILNATLLITTPIDENPQGGSLQRPSYLNTNEKEYDKMPLNSITLKNKLINLLAYLSEDIFS